MHALTPYGLLGGLSVSAGDKLRSLGRRRVFGPSDPLFRFASHDLSAALITSGLVKLTAASDDGRGVILSVLGEGDLLGEERALRALCPDRNAPGGDSDAEARALTAVTARVIPHAALRTFFEDCPEAVAAVALGLRERLVEVESQL